MAHNKAGRSQADKKTKRRQQQMKTAIVRLIAACSLAAAFISPAVAAEPIVFGLVDEVAERSLPARAEREGMNYNDTSEIRKQTEKIITIIETEEIIIPQIVVSGL